MTRLLLALLACALTVSAQDQATPTRIALADAVVTDSAGRPVTNLTLADFEVTEDGKPVTVVRLTAFDTVRHTAVTLGQLPALELTPDEIHRTMVIVVDDLCLTQDGIREVRRRITQMIETQLVSGDRVAILRTSSGAGREQQLSSDPRQIARTVEAIQYLGGGTGRQACASAAWSTVSYALGGLGAIPGRKAVVLMSGDLPAPAGITAREIARLAARSATGLYLVAAIAPALASSAGGVAGVDLDRAFAEQRSFYVLAYAGGGGRELVVKSRHPDLVLRSHTAAIEIPARNAVPSPPTTADLVLRVMNSPFESTAVGVQLTALFFNRPPEGPIVEGLLHMDAHDLSYLRDDKGKYHLEFEVYMASVLEAGQAAPPAARLHTVEITEEQYRQALAEGLAFRFPLNAWTAGTRQVRAVVADGRSGRIGTARTFVEVHDLARNELFLSGIMLQSSSGSVKDSPAVRAFRTGKPLQFEYSVYNLTQRQDGRSEVESQVRIFTAGREIYAGTPIPLQFEPAADARGRQVNGTISLDSSIGPGRYILQISVTDKLHPQPRSASQFIDFAIEPQALP